MIKVMVDSSADCRSTDGIFDYLVPITVTLDGVSYRDGIDLDGDTFYELLTKTADFPKTSQPSPADFLEVFEQVKAAEDELIYFALSSGVSGTYQSACIAKSMVDYDGIHVIDTKAATHMIRMMLSYAEGLIADGLSAAEVVFKCEELKGRIKILVGVETLEYLRRGGRLSNASAFVGTLANIKPVITVTEEGKVEAIGKALGVTRAMQFICDKVKKDAVDERFPVYSLYTCGIENTEKLEAKLSALDMPVTDRLQIGSTIGTHVGPGLYGICYVTK